MADRPFEYTVLSSNNDLVPCKRCGELISFEATRCPKCGLHFLGHAVQFMPDDAGPVHHFSPLVRYTILGALAILVLAFAYWMITTIARGPQ